MEQAGVFQAAVVAASEEAAEECVNYSLYHAKQAEWEDRSGGYEESL